MDHHTEEQSDATTPQTEGADAGAEESLGGSEKGDREEGGPTSPAEPSEETSAGGGHGTRESGFDAHD